MLIIRTLKPALRGCAVALAIAGLAGAASATVLKSTTYPANWSFTGTTAVNVPLAAGVTVFPVRAPAAGTYSLTFSAECSVDAPADNSGGWVDIDVVVNGTAVPPTAGTSDAFCGADGVVGYSSWVRPSITVAVELKKGRNEIEIRARLNAGATGGWISDSSLVIDD